MAPIKFRNGMGQDQPLLLALMIAATGVVAKWWIGDYRAAARQAPSPRPLPGATPAPGTATVVAVAGALLLLAAETAGEYALGISERQSRITFLFGVYTLAAAFPEELIFRGYVVVTGRGRAMLAGSVIGASLLFALLHPFLWEWEKGAVVLHGDAKAWFSTGAVFAGSLWFYFVRFMPLNPQQSLLPCVAAHAAKNLGVVAVKLAQGHVSGWW
jgi:membrane protease YdiL (CAAX protease family)